MPVRFAEFVRELEHSALSPVYWIYGTEDYLKQEAVEKITQKYLGHEPSELEKKLIYADDATKAEAILDEAINIPLFVAKKVVIVKAFDQLKEEEQEEIIKYAKEPSHDSCLIIVSDFRKKNSTLGKYAKSCECLPFYDNRTLSAWIVKKTNSLGKQITDEAIELIIEKIGKNLLMLTQELNKLSIYVGNKNTIEVNDVEKISGELVIHTIFDLCDAIGFKEQEKALKLLQELIRDEESKIIFAMIIRHFRMLWHAKLLQAKGSSLMDICDVLEIRRAFMEKFFNQIDSMNLTEFPRIFERFLKTDLELKKSADPKLALELLTIDLCTKKLSGIVVA